jgi:hypothetical protein
MIIDLEHNNPVSAYVMVSADDIDQIIKNLQILKIRQEGHFDIINISESENIIANVEISFFDHKKSDYIID